jgi:hypothetical protein
MDQQTGLQAVREQVGAGGGRRREQIGRIGSQSPDVELSLQILARLARGIGDQPNWQAGAAQLVEGLKRSRQEVLPDGDDAADVQQNTSDHVKSLPEAQS